MSHHPDATASIFADILEKRLSRRSLLAASGAAGLVSFSPFLPAQDSAPSTLSFKELPHGLDEHLAVAEGYEAQTLISWGDPIFADAPAFDPEAQTADKQRRQFGFNNDYVGFLPLPINSRRADHGLLVVNHEYTIPSLMFPGSPSGTELNKALTDVDIAAHGLSVVEIRRVSEHWHIVQDSSYNRRITPLTEMRMTGPASGNDRLRTQYSADGVQTFGTYGNCAGGVTPWGTVLTGEENVDGYFQGDIEGSGEEANYERFGMGSQDKSWGHHYERWNLASNPKEPLHVGWIVEVDPYDPESVPKKRTALGRFKHEGCNVFINNDGHVAAYTGDDERFEYIYRFISRHAYDPDDRQANMRLLDEGTLSAARFNDDGTLDWLPLVFGEGPLTETNGFRDQGDVMLDARKAADLLGATPMDRPEDVEVNPVNGRVYAMLTNNSRRSPAQVDGTNPRAENRDGQIVEFWPESGDHSSDSFLWDLVLIAGNPATTEGTLYHSQITENGWLSCPDNCAFDQLGNLWIATDGAEGTQGVADGIWATELAGPNRALTRRFLRTPIGAELCGPEFTPDDSTLFCAVQHPGDGGNYETPLTRWPDFRDDMPPRPSVAAITRRGGGRVGS